MKLFVFIAYTLIIFSLGFSLASVLDDVHYKRIEDAQQWRESVYYYLYATPYLIQSMEYARDTHQSLIDDNWEMEHFKQLYPKSANAEAQQKWVDIYEKVIIALKYIKGG